MAWISPSWPVYWCLGPGRTGSTITPQTNGNAAAAEPVKGPASHVPSIEKKYGRPIADWKDLIRASPLTEHMDRSLKTEHAAWAAATPNVEGPHRKRWGPSTYCPVRAMAEDTRFELVRGCPQQAFQMFVRAFGDGHGRADCGGASGYRRAELWCTPANETRTETGRAFIYRPWGRTTAWLGR
ncbi:DUF4287 domain-containing protein [Streptomyces sp. NPDC048590]|uniref:DUF4287 domain-containing protein n=1 Tax=Streptomyces sp. NPDC048590 TaxID=3365574 RepID=UPI0037225477